jgi:hypothetical protein
MKKLAEFSRRLDLEDEKLRKNEEFTENFEKTVAQEMYVREEEAKAHEQWMRQKDLEEQSKFILDVIWDLNLTPPRGAISGAAIFKLNLPQD